MKSETIELVRGQVRAATPRGTVEIIARQIERAEEAAHRIDEEGVVVRDMKGSVIAHPAIQIEINAGKIIADLLGKNKRQGGGRGNP